MPLASVFADLDGYTRYIDACMATDCLPIAVRLLHILRTEFNAVVQQDFKGRKVRYIGDCIHALLAEGTAYETDATATVETATRCAGALRSSFDLCRALVEHADRVGLAIGFEYGWTPVSRIGIRGERSVRAASSLATRGSEQAQRDCGGEQTKIGPNAFGVASVAVRKLFGPARVVSGLNYAMAVATGSPKIAPVAVAPLIMSTPAIALPTSRAYSH